MSEIGDDSPEHWPRAGDRLFVQSDWAVDALIATFRGERLYRMKKAFKTAGDLLVSHSEENTQERSNLVWPVVFCYRQYVELALKDMIAEHGSNLVIKGTDLFLPNNSLPRTRKKPHAADFRRYASTKNRWLLQAWR